MVKMSPIVWCEQCPSCTQEPEDKLRCDRVRKVFEPKDLVNSFPSWCPLAEATQMDLRRIHYATDAAQFTHPEKT